MMVASGTYEGILAIIFFGAVKQVSFGAVSPDA